MSKVICPKCRITSSKIVEGSIWLYRWCEYCLNYFAVRVKHIIDRRVEKKPVRKLEAGTPSSERIEQKKSKNKKGENIVWYN